MRLEGTVRGTGGIHITDESCGTGVPGLYAAGDAATRELICGGFTGGGSHNAAWAMSSGSFAGEGAAVYAQSLGSHAAQRSPVGLSSSPLVHQEVKPGVAAQTAEYVSAVQAEVKPYDINLFRTEQGLTSALDRLDGLWKEQRSREIQRTPEGVKAREAEAMTATARWMYNSALARTETRGMHKREDFKDTDHGQHHRLISGGLDQVWVKTEGVAKEGVLS